MFHAESTWPTREVTHSVKCSAVPYCSGSALSRLGTNNRKRLKKGDCNRHLDCETAAKRGARADNLVHPPRNRVAFSRSQINTIRTDVWGGQRTAHRLGSGKALSSCSSAEVGAKYCRFGSRVGSHGMSGYERQKRPRGSLLRMAQQDMEQNTKPKSTQDTTGDATRFRAR